jgi:hypothetical protein
MTDDQVRALLNREGAHTDDSLYAAAEGLARALLDARAENARLRADAQAAVALVVERFAHECEQNATYYLGEGEPRKRAAFLQAAKEARQLAPVDGLAMVEALRKERDAGWTEAKYQEAERDRLTADLAAAQAQIEALREPLLQIQAGPLLGADMQHWIKWAMKTAALAALPAKEG